MRNNDSWLGSGSDSSYSRGSHYRNSRRSVAGFSRVIIIIIVLLVVVSAIQLARPVPLPRAQQTIVSADIPGKLPSLPWPSQGGGEVELQNVGTIGVFNANAQIPLASVAKIVTALVIVKDHPVSSGNNGPTLTLSATDVATYQTMLQQQDSVMAVANGEKLSEYQLLEALLIPSADNIAVTLAVWDAGSVTAFVAKMNAMAKSLGMAHTDFKDPSGLKTGTVGSAADEVLAAQALLKNKVLAQIVAKAQATLPVVGVVYNVNYNVGHDGFVGIKTGSMGNGGNLVFAATGVGSNDLIVGAILGQSGVQPLISALTESTKLVNAARKVPNEFSVLKLGQRVGMIVAPGSQPIPVSASKGLTFIGCPGLHVGYTSKFSKLNASVAKGAKIGELTVTVGDQSQSVALIADESVQSPSLAWRLKRL